MAEESAIAWTKSTFNPWIGCTEVGDGCLGCYARELDAQRLSKSLGGATKAHPISHWGHGAPRYRTKEANWNQVRRWNRQAPGTTFAGRRGFWPVFCSSLADVFDNEVPDQWRSDLWDLIEETPNLSWLLVTKRIGNAARMLRTHDWAAARPNVRILITVVNQEEADRDIPKLLALSCKNGLSYEPALGPVNLRRYLCGCRTCVPGTGVTAGGFPNSLQWVIIGGESAQGHHAARLFDVWWARDVIEQCKYAHVPVFMKQLGNAVAFRNSPWELPGQPGERPDCAWKDPDEWPADLRVQEFPA